MKKAFVISTDILIASSLFMLSLVMLGVFYQPRGYSEQTYDRYYRLSSDSLVILQRLRICDVLNNSLINSYVLSGDITSEDWNRTVLDLIGTFWADNRTGDAAATTENFLGSFFLDTQSFEVVIGGDTIYMKNVSASSQIVKNSALISGYLVGKPTFGYVARAWLQKARGLETEAITISPAGSGFGLFYFRGGPFSIEKTFSIPSDADNITAELDLSVHEDWGDVDVYINNILQKSQYVSGTYYDSFEVSNITPGNNTLRIDMGRPFSYHCHTHPGTVLRVHYLHDKNLTYEEEKDVLRREYLPKVIGSPSAWMIFPFDIPKSSALNSASLHLETLDVNALMEVWVNGHKIYDGPPLGTYDVNISGYLNAELGNSTGETNILSVYLDIESDKDVYVSGARGTSTISNESYIELGYSLPEERRIYGSISATKFLEFGRLDGQGSALTKTAFFNWTDFIITSAYAHIVQEYSWRVASAAWHSPEAEPSWNGTDWTDYQVFKSPTMRSVPSSFYIDLDRFGDDVTNYLKARDFDSGSSNHILENSTIELNFLVPAQVGYGAVFADSASAVSDAIFRLNQTVLGYVDSGEIDSQTMDIINVPSLWDLTSFEVMVW